MVSTKAFSLMLIKFSSSSYQLKRLLLTYFSTRTLNAYWEVRTKVLSTNSLSVLKQATIFAKSSAESISTFSPLKLFLMNWSKLVKLFPLFFFNYPQLNKIRGQIPFVIRLVFSADVSWLRNYFQVLSSLTSSNNKAEIKYTKSPIYSSSPFM